MLVTASDSRPCAVPIVCQPSEALNCFLRTKMDVLVLGGQLDACFIAKSEVGRWPLIGTIARLGRTVYVRRARSSTGRERDEMRVRMILCPTCGCKRCPKASDHDLACTGSNEPGQSGSVYA